MTVPPEWIASLPEDLRGNETIANIPDVATLAKQFIETKNGDWKAALPEDLRADASLGSFKGIPDLAKSFIETKKLVGQKFAPPGDEATEEEWNTFFGKIGVPEKPEGYKYTKPEIVEIPAEVEKTLLSQAHKMKLTPRQTQAFLNQYAEERKAMNDRDIQATREADERLRKEWGGNYTRNMALISRTLDQIDPEKTLRAFLNDTGLGNHPVMINLLHRWSKRLVEDNIIPGDVEGVATREQARLKIAEIQKDLKHPYHTSKSGDPIFEEVRKLHQIAYD